MPQKVWGDLHYWQVNDFNQDGEYMRTFKNAFFILMVSLLGSCGGGNSEEEAPLNCNSGPSMDPIVGGWSCTDSSGASGRIVFREEGYFGEIGVTAYPNAGGTPGKAWEPFDDDYYNYLTSPGLFISGGFRQVRVDFSDNNESFTLEPDYPFSDTLSCQKTACSQTADDPIIGIWSCTNQDNYTAETRFLANGLFLSYISIVNALVDEWYNAGQGIYVLTDVDSDEIYVEFSNNNNNMKITHASPSIGVINCTKN